jgi:hypothetical protein
MNGNWLPVKTCAELGVTETVTGGGVGEYEEEM